MAYTDEEVQKLADAMWQLLDDMGASGTCVCGAAKAQARIAYEPWYKAEKLAEKTYDDGSPLYSDWMTLEAAQAIMDDL